jgi:HAD superfamily hydrolase (TIGR01509 family)
MRFMGVIFDLDGTLVASESTYLRAWYQAAETVGRGMDDALYARLMGLNRADTIRQLGEIWAAPALAQRFVDESQRVYDSLVAGEGHLVRPGVLELLDHLASRGLPLAVATSSHRQLAKDTLVAADLAKYFQSLAAGDEVTQGKPAPDIYLLAAARLGVPPERGRRDRGRHDGGADSRARGGSITVGPGGRALC